MTIIKSGSAITILNAIKSDKGAAIGVHADIGIEIINSDSLEYITDTDDRLLKQCVELFDKKYNLNTRCKIRSFSSIPASRGMKTSSSISSSLIAALAEYHSINMYNDEIIALGAQASVDAGVSITGAIDDAYAAFLGGVSYTNTAKRSLISHSKIPDYLIDKHVIMMIPVGKNEKKDILEKLDNIDRSLTDKAIESMEHTDIISAMRLNTMAYAPFLLEKPDIIDEIYSDLGLEIYLNGAGPSLFGIVSDNKIVSISERIKNSYNEFELVKTKFRDL